MDGSRPERIEWFLKDHAFSQSMIRLHAHPIQSSHLNKLDRLHKERLRKKDNLFLGEGQGMGVRPQESLALCKSFNTLCSCLYSSAWLTACVCGGWLSEGISTRRHTPFSYRENTMVNYVNANDI